MQTVAGEAPNGPLPTWASLSAYSARVAIGALAHISKVKSICFDTWTEAELKHMEGTGNAKANTFFELNVTKTTKLTVEASAHERLTFIRNKYQHRWWYGVPKATENASYTFKKRKKSHPKKQRSKDKIKKGRPKNNNTADAESITMAGSPSLEKSAPSARSAPSAPQEKGPLDPFENMYDTGAQTGIQDDQANLHLFNAESVLSTMCNTRLDILEFESRHKHKAKVKGMEVTGAQAVASKTPDHSTLFKLLYASADTKTSRAATCSTTSGELTKISDTNVNSTDSILSLFDNPNTTSITHNDSASIRRQIRPGNIAADLLDANKVVCRNRDDSVPTVNRSLSLFQPRDAVQLLAPPNTPSRSLVDDVTDDSSRKPTKPVDPWLLLQDSATPPSIRASYHGSRSRISTFTNTAGHSHDVTSFQTCGRAGLGVSKSSSASKDTVTRRFDIFADCNNIGDMNHGSHAGSGPAVNITNRLQGTGLAGLHVRRAQLGQRLPDSRCSSESTLDRPLDSISQQIF